MESLHNTSDSLIARILSDAQAEAETIARQAQHTVAAMEQDSAARLDALRRDAEKKRQAEVQAVLDGSRTRAELDARKAVLSGKHALMDGVYRDAYAGLCALTGDRRKALIRALAVREACDGDTLVPAAKDRAIVRDMLASLPVHVTVSDTDASVSDGFVLLGRGYEKDCSFRAVMTEAWTEAETETASLLFS